MTASASSLSQAVLLEVNFQHVFGINPAAANFTCVFEAAQINALLESPLIKQQSAACVACLSRHVDGKVRMAWLDERAKACSSSMALDAKRRNDGRVMEDLACGSIRRVLQVPRVGPTKADGPERTELLSRASEQLLVVTTRSCFDVEGSSAPPVRHEHYFPVRAGGR